MEAQENETGGSYPTMAAVSAETHRIWWFSVMAE
jgi:hypothetical protein